MPQAKADRTFINSIAIMLPKKSAATSLLKQAEREGSIHWNYAYGQNRLYLICADKNRIVNGIFILKLDCMS